MIFWIAAALLTAICVTFVWQALLAHLPASRQTKWIALSVAVIIPISALSLYWRIGSVGMPDFPVSQRPTHLQANHARMLTERPLIRELRANPKNEDAWLQLITLYVETNRMDRARQAHTDAVLSVPHSAKLHDPALHQMLNLPEPKACQPPAIC